MKKLVLLLVFILVASTAFVSCRDQKKTTKSEETNMEMEGENNDSEVYDDSVGDDLEEAANDVGDAVEEAAKETADAAETAAEETADAAEEAWDEVKENTGTGGTDDK